MTQASTSVPTRSGRPAGECHLAILRAAHAVRLERLNAGQGATLAELVARSQVGYKVARALVANMRRSGHLAKVGEVRVQYRNRPVALYMPTLPAPQPAPHTSAGDLSQAMRGWVSKQ